MKQKSALIRISMFVVIFLFMSINSFAQYNSVLVDPSEEWLNNQHKPEKLIEAIGLKEGMTIADIGAGRGRMSVWFSAKVGNTGKVYANDIDKEALTYLENRCKKNSLSNVTAILGEVDDPLLPKGEIDIAFMISTYHHLENPVALMRNAAPCLKKGGIMVVVERDPVKTGQSGRESTSKEKLVSQMSEAGYVLLKADSTLLDRDNIYFFKVK